MDFVKGIVKKYYRSYNRTLKDGTKKTYKTEQVQVTVSKSDNIFEDKEEVFILPISQADELNELDEMQSAYELFNGILTVDNEKLSNELNITKEELNNSSSKLEAILDELDKKEEELEESKKRLHILKEDCSSLKDQLSENKNTISSLRKQLDDKNFIIADLNDDLNLLNDKLNSQNNDNLNNSNGLNANNAPNSEFMSNEQFLGTSSSYSFDDYVDLQKEYIALLKKYERSQEDLYNEKVKVIHYKNLLDKFKSFILRIQ
jgi:chromosome segregation ATPase